MLRAWLWDKWNKTLQIVLFCVNNRLRSAHSISTSPDYFCISTHSAVCSSIVNSHLALKQQVRKMKAAASEEELESLSSVRFLHLPLLLWLHLPECNP